MKLGFFVTGDVTGIGTGNIVDGLLDGVTYLAPSNNPPVADAGATTSSITCLATSCSINLDGTQSSDIDSTAGTNDDIVSFEWFEDTNGDGTLDPSELLVAGETATVSLALGMHYISLRCTY